VAGAYACRTRNADVAQSNRTGEIAHTETATPSLTYGDLHPPSATKFGRPAPAF
jgi:hypothetical protein